jgi:hypothetical protein
MSIELHKDLIDKNSTLWNRKPLLRVVYADLYRTLAHRLSQSGGPSVELGSCMG